MCSDKSYKLVAICGDFKLDDVYKEVVTNLTLDGKIVVPKCTVPKTVLSSLTTKQSKDLNDLNMERLSIADEVFVINSSGHYDEEIIIDILRCKFLNKPITFLDKVSEGFINDLIVSFNLL